MNKATPSIPHVTQAFGSVIKTIECTAPSPEYETLALRDTMVLFDAIYSGKNTINGNVAAMRLRQMAHGCGCGKCRDAAVVGIEYLLVLVGLC